MADTLSERLVDGMLIIGIFAIKGTVALLGAPMLLII